MGLLEAANALAAGDRERALAELLETWRMVRHPRIADLVDCVSDELTATRPPIKGKTVTARTKAWLEVEQQHDPADLGRLLATPWPGTWKPALAILEPLRARPDDPRIAMAFARVLAATPYDTWKSDAFYVPLIRKLEALGDLRTLPLLRTQLGKRPSYYYMRDVRPYEIAVVQALVARFPDDEPPALEDATLAALAPLEARYAEQLAGARETAEGTVDHLAAIYAAPDDLAARAVYADWLQERGDPRGELIALQLARLEAPPSDAAIVREHKLLEQHGEAWAGPIASWFEDNSREFHAGFFAGGRLRWRSDTMGSVSDPAWALVRILDGSDGTIRELLDRPELRSLRDVRVEYATAIALAGGVIRPWTALHWRTNYELGTPPLDTALARCESLPALREIGFDTSHTEAHAAWIAAAPVVERLERLVIPLEMSLIVEAGKRAGALRELEIGRRVWRVILQRDAGSGAFRRLVIRPLGGPLEIEQLAPILRDIPADTIRELVITSPKKKLDVDQAARETLAAAIARFDKLERCEVPWPELVARAPEPAPKPTRTGPLVDIRLEGTTLFAADKAAAFWQLVNVELGLQYDSFEVGSKWRALGEDPVKRIQTWANNKRCYDIALYRDGVLGKSRLHKPRHGSGTTMLEIPLGDPAEFVEWFARLVELAPFTCGYAITRTVDTPWRAFDMADLHCGVSAGWLLYFGPAQKPLLPPDEVAALGHHPRLAGLFARPTTHGLLVGLAPTPDDVTAARLTAAAQGFVEIVKRQLPNHLGYDFHERANAILLAGANAFGLASAPAERNHMQVRWQSRSEPVRLLADLDRVYDQPRVSVALHAQNESGNYVGYDLVRRTVANRAGLETALASALAELRVNGQAFLADPDSRRRWLNTDA